MNISYTDVESSCSEMHAIVNRMKQSLDDVEKNYSTLSTGDDWCGDAADSYISKLKTIVSMFDNAYNETEYAILFMAKCSEGYQMVDQNIMGQLCSDLNISQPSLNGSKIFSQFD